jgi:hypothetical protein
VLLSTLMLAGLSIAVSAQTGPDAVLQITPTPLRVGDYMFPEGFGSTGDITNYRFFCEDGGGNEVALASGSLWAGYVVSSATYGACCAGGTCEVGESITVSLEVTDAAVGLTSTDSRTTTIWPEPINTDMHYNMATSIPRTEVALELRSGSDILNNYNGKVVFVDDRDGWDGRFGYAKDYPKDLIYPWATYAVAQSPFNSKLMVVISLDNVAGQPSPQIRDGKAMFISNYPTYVWAAAIVEHIDGRVEERWVRAMGDDMRASSQSMPLTTQAVTLCAYSKPADPKVPFVATAIPSDTPTLPGSDCPEALPINKVVIDGRTYQVVWKDAGYNLMQCT